jgi:hypothetical protein
VNSVLRRMAGSCHPGCITCGFHGIYSGGFLKTLMELIIELIPGSINYQI